MTLLRILPSWHVPESRITTEAAFLHRRAFLRRGAALAASSIVAPSLLAACGETEAALFQDPAGAASRPALRALEAKRNAKYVVEGAFTPESVSSRYNNFYEFTTDKGLVWKLAERMKTSPWSVEIAGEAKRTGVFDVEDLMKALPLEERAYRFRCVEAWAMTVPWIGIPMKAFLDWADPRGDATHVRFVSFLDPKNAPGQQPGSGSTWPYYEGLRLDEAANELALLAVGIYGHVLPPQHGAPIRVITPWKYGFKSAKSVVRIEFVKAQPKTFWNDAAPREYGFLANVEPDVPHPRWSQATETDIGTGERRPTLPYNGYGALVAGMYPKKGG